MRICSQAKSAQPSEDLRRRAELSLVQANGTADGALPLAVTNSIASQAYLEAVKARLAADRIRSAAYIRFQAIDSPRSRTRMPLLEDGTAVTDLGLAAAKEALALADAAVAAVAAVAAANAAVAAAIEAVMAASRAR